VETRALLNLPKRLLINFRIIFPTDYIFKGLVKFPTMMMHKHGLHPKNEDFRILRYYRPTNFDY